MTLLSHPFFYRFLWWPVILDSNLLLLYWCSSFDPLLLNSFKRLHAFDKNDLLVLADVLDFLGELKTTPHVLTEVSNLANSLPSWRRQGWTEHYVKGVACVPEIYQPASLLLKDPLLNQLGLTDAALAYLASEHVVLTMDGRLAALLRSRGLAGIDFRLLRPGGLLT